MLLVMPGGKQLPPAPKNKSNPFSFAFGDDDSDEEDEDEVKQESKEEEPIEMILPSKGSFGGKFNQTQGKGFFGGKTGAKKLEIIADDENEEE